MRKVVFLALLAALLPAVAALAETPAEKQMAEKIGNQLKQSGQLHNYRIGVKFHNGTAYLEGTVTSVEQRTTAVRLAERVKGVARVDYKLEIPNKSEIPPNPESTNEPKPAPDRERFRLAAALDRAHQTGMEADSSRVTQAYEPAAMPNQQMRSANAGAMTRMPMRGNNMPLPSRQMPGMRMASMPMNSMPARQPGGVYQTAGYCPTCNGGGGMAPGMGMGPGMDGASPAAAGFVPQGMGRGPSYDNASMPGYAWPSYASYPNYAALSYPQQYSPTAWPYIGPFYPYPQVPLAWRKVSLEWDDGWWFLDFSAHNSSH
jgi:hypothetical protein